MQYFFAEIITDFYFIFIFVKRKHFAFRERNFFAIPISNEPLFEPIEKRNMFPKQYQKSFRRTEPNK